jgi:hypothetical protein
MIPTAHVVHRGRGRLRLRVADRRKDAAWLEGAAACLAELPGVHRVEVGILTGSLLVHHGGEYDLEPAIRALDLWRLEDAPPAEVPPLQSLNDMAASLEREMRALAPGAPDLRTLLFLSLAGLGVAQIVRGQITAPATSLLWYALELLARNQSSPSGSGT